MGCAERWSTPRYRKQDGVKCGNIEGLWMRFVQARLVRLQQEQGSRGSKGERKEQMLSEEPRSEQRQGRKKEGGGRGGEKRRGCG